MCQRQQTIVAGSLRKIGLMGLPGLSLSMLPVGYTVIPLTSPFLLHVIGMLVKRILTVLWSDVQWSQASVREVGLTFIWPEWIVEFPGELRQETKRPLEDEVGPSRCISFSVGR